MVSLAIIALVISQLISFFLIILLYMKVSKFKHIEARQQKVIEEMDDAIGTYLMEMKEENDRLIHELTKPKPAQTRPMQPPVASILQTVQQAEVAPTKVSAYKPTKQVKPPLQYKQPDLPTKVLDTFEQQVLALREEGLSIEEIAKRTQKGKTEIELLVKFHG